MENVVSIVKRIKQKNQLALKRNRDVDFEKRKQKFIYLTTPTQPVTLLEEDIGTNCDVRYCINGRTYKGRCLKENIFIELDYLKSVGVYDFKLYSAYNKQGRAVPTHFAIFGRDKYGI